MVKGRTAIILGDSSPDTATWMSVSEISIVSAQHRRVVFVFMGLLEINMGNDIPCEIVVQGCLFLIYMAIV